MLKQVGARDSRRLAYVIHFYFLFIIISGRSGRLSSSRTCRSLFYFLFLLFRSEREIVVVSHMSFTHHLLVWTHAQAQAGAAVLAAIHGHYLGPAPIPYPFPIPIPILPHGLAPPLVEYATDEIATWMTTPLANCECRTLLATWT